MKSLLFAGLCLLSLLPSLAKAQPDASEKSLGVQVEELVGQLLADRQADREAARQKLLDLAGGSVPRAERVLGLLPTEDDQLPPALRRQINDLRVEIEKRIAKSVVHPTLVTLDAVDAPLDQVLSAIELQTENKLLDNRKQFGQEAKDQLISIKKSDASFWETMDELLDQAHLDVYAYSGEDALALVNADEGRALRTKNVSYAGPFRVEATGVTAVRNLRQPKNRSLRLEMEVSWEPRLRPIAVIQDLSDVVATNEEGARLPVKQPSESINLELAAGNQATELYLPLELPDRGTHQVATLRGTLKILAPGRTAKFVFKNLKQGADPIPRRQGGVTVTLVAARKNGEIWEVHMRLKLDQPGEALASHRGWVFDNKTYLLDKDGTPIDHAGFETTMQTQEEIGLAYLFDHEPGIEGLTWVYETPSSVHRFPIEYVLSDIDLP
ncbi:MAG: hypothetical protein KDA37_03010 [Planctomycetales bacterium]|nr:hypothetical protein [Planctomycetales bacterium]